MMNARKHTPGPWRFEDRGRQGFTVISDHGYPIIRESYAGDYSGSAWAEFDEEADAKLTAASPDMLDALHKARIELGAFVQVGAGPSTKRAFDAVCAAIAKATGDA